MKAGAFSPATRALAMERSGGICEMCGARPVAELHHRRPRRSGGSRDPETASVANLAALCSPCHHSVESHRRWAMDCGWLVSQWGPGPAEVPVRMGRRLVLLADDGTTTDVEEEAA